MPWHYIDPKHEPTDEGEIVENFGGCMLLLMILATLVAIAYLGGGLG